MYPLSILYVEDESIYHTIFEDFFKNDFEQIYCALDGEQGYKLFLDRNPDIIITDFKMPLLDGIGLIKKIRQIDQQLPIIVISSFGEQHELIQSIELGVSHYLLKPITKENLSNILFELAELIVLKNKQLIMKERLSSAHQSLDYFYKMIDKHLMASETDPQGVILSVSNKLCEVSGYSKTEFIGNTHKILRNPKVPDLLYHDLWVTITKGMDWRDL
jgi:YesN/AraC family two-component response regulator